MSGFKELIEDLKARRRKASMGGGETSIAKQHSIGKKTARERLDLLLDTGSFVETEAFVTHRCHDFGMEKKVYPGDGVVTGYGRINGRGVFIAAADFTVMGGSLGEMHSEKITTALKRALSNGVPFIQLNDSGGARIQEGVPPLNAYGSMFRTNVEASGVIPQLSAILGPCAGGAVYSPLLTDFVFMVEGISRMFVTGPDVIKAVTGEETTFEELGGAMTHNRISGNAHFYAQTEEECFARMRELLSYLPSNRLEEAPIDLDPDESPSRRVPEVLETLPEDPRQGYDMRDIIRAVLDRGIFLEIQPFFAPNVVVGFGRLMGRTLGVVANQPQVLAGCLDMHSSDKVARFVRFADAFGIPIVNFVDVPGFLPGVAQEHGGIIRHGAKLLYAYSEATVPKITVIVRKAFGGAYIGMCSRDLGYDRVLAWPTAEIAVLGAEAAANIIFRREIAAAEDPEARREEKIREFREKFSNPYQAAKLKLVDDVIDPADTRAELVRSMEMFFRKRASGPRKKHGNMPL